MPQGGRYILCDRCQKSTFSLNLPWPKDGETMKGARQAGWRIIREEDVNFVEDVCPACIEVENGPQKGEVFEFNGSNPFLITPVCIPVTVTVVHNDGQNIHYRTDREPSKVKQTPIERFMEIVKS